MTDPLDQLRLRDLMLLEHIAGLGTLRRVAQTLHVTQPAVTQMLHGLERAMGAALVERGRRGVSLTGAGQAALLRLRSARQELEQARLAAQRHGQPMLRLGATPIATLRLLPQAIERLVALAPDVRITLTEAGVHRLWEQLAEGRLDAVVGRLPSDAPPLAGLRYERVGEERMVLVVGRQHPLASQARAPRGRHAWQRVLAQCAWVLRPDNGPSTQSLREGFSTAGVAVPGPQVVSGAYQASLNMVAKAPLVTLVPETAARMQAEALGLQLLHTSWPPPRVQLVFAAREAHWALAPIASLRTCFPATTPP